MRLGMYQSTYHKTSANEPSNPRNRKGSVRYQFYMCCVSSNPLSDLICGNEIRNLLRFQLIINNLYESLSLLSHYILLLLFIFLRDISSVFNKKIMDENDPLSEYNNISLVHNGINGAVYSKINFKVEICSAL